MVYVNYWGNEWCGPPSWNVQGRGDIEKTVAHRMISGRFVTMGLKRGAVNSSVCMGSLILKIEKDGIRWENPEFWVIVISRKLMDRPSGFKVNWRGGWNELRVDKRSWRELPGPSQTQETSSRKRFHRTWGLKLHAKSFLLKPALYTPATSGERRLPVGKPSSKTVFPEEQ